MPTKMLYLQAGRTGSQKTFKFGGGANTVFANDDGVSDFGYIINGGGGNDTIFGSDFFRLVPDPDNEGEFLIDGGDLLIGGDGSDLIVGGAGNDTIFGGSELDNSDNGKGKSGPPTNTLFGDGTGGFDEFGDPLVSITFTSGDPITWGIDTINGGNESINLIYGDFFSVNVSGTATFTGGNDILTGGTSFGGTATANTLYGDAVRISVSDAGGTFKGGNDTLTALEGASSGDANIAINKLYGDVAQVFSGDGTFIGGNDTLIGGSGSTDHMYGDFATNSDGTIVQGGEDTFEIGVGGGMDTIFDFRSTDDDPATLLRVGDKVKLVETGLDWKLDLDTNDNGFLDDDDTHVSVSGATTKIDLGQAIDAAATADVDTITFQNLTTALIESDFVFV